MVYLGGARPYFTLDDETQRAPELLAIKRSVDVDPRPGRFLLTGSADLMTLPTVADSLAGRMEVVPLYPLSQAEIAGTPSDFLDAAFAGRFTAGGTATVRGESLTARVLAGGYPEAVQRAAPERRRRWHREYLQAILRRDVADIAALDRLTDLPRLVERVAVANGQLVNFAALATDLAMDRKTARRYVDVLAATLSGLTLERVHRERSALGPVYETFVFGELRKLASFRESPVTFHHFRGRETEEVDLVLEDVEGRLVGIAVKASATATAADFRGLRVLANAAGRRFAAGLLLHDGELTIPFGERLWAMPIERLWTVFGRIA